MTDRPTPRDRERPPHPEDGDPKAPQAAASRPPGRPRPSGVVLPRLPDADRPGSWRLAPPPPRPPARRPPSIVDAVDGEGRPSGGSGKSSPIVDATDEGGAAFSIVDAGDEEFGLPARPDMGLRPPPVPTRLRGPAERRHADGPSGPDEDRLRDLRDANRRKLADRARARGRDPGAGSREVAPGVTRSAKTHEEYLRRGRMLVTRYRRQRGLANTSLDSLDPVDFANWFLSLKPTLKSTAWRPYRQSAKAILESFPLEGAETAIAMIEADVPDGTSTTEGETEAASTQDRGKMPRRTSALKEKRFPKADFDKVVAYLRHFSRSGLAPVLADWLVAGIWTGLRPVEWQATELEVREDRSAKLGRRAWLYVLNAKSTNGRGNGVVRTLDVSGFSDDALRAVRRMSEAGSGWLLSGTFDTMQSQCAQLLYATSEKLFGRGGKVYALYSVRHQFVANHKAIRKPEEVSALVGHVVTTTAAENYGRRRSAWEPHEVEEIPDPVPEEVATVRKQLQFYEERMRLQRLAGIGEPSSAVPEEGVE